MPPETHTGCTAETVARLEATIARLVFVLGLPPRLRADVEIVRAAVEIAIDLDPAAARPWLAVGEVLRAGPATVVADTDQGLPVASPRSSEIRRAPRQEDGA
jgi:hypothetical protein